MNDVATLTALSVLETRVANGAAVLDDRHPGWRNLIDVDRIESACHDHSVIGQLVGSRITDQLWAVGIEPTAVNEGFDSLHAFEALGMCVMANDPLSVPTKMRDKAIEVFGIPAEIIPTVIPVPRDPDVMIMEERALTDLWVKEVNKR